MSQPHISIEIPGAPVAKGRPRITRGSNGTPRAYTPAKTARYEDLIRLKAGEIMEGRLPLDQPLRVRVMAFLPIPDSWTRKKRLAAVSGQFLPISRPDADNYLKAALDGMNAIVFTDDSRVTDVYVCKRYSEKPRLLIEVFL